MESKDFVFEEMPNEVTTRTRKMREKYERWQAGKSSE